MSSDVPMNGASFPSAHSHTLNGAVLATQTGAQQPFSNTQTGITILVRGLL